MFNGSPSSAVDPAQRSPPLPTPRATASNIGYRRSDPIYYLPSQSRIGYNIFVSAEPDDRDGDRIELPFRSKAVLVTDYLRAELQAGRPGPGERLVVSRIADKLGVSKVPVREAVTQLIGEGLLELKPNVGPVVPLFTPHEIVETALMRVAIDSAAMDSAVPLHDKNSLGQLADLLAAMDDADDEFTALNVSFHMAVLEPSPYREMLRTSRMLLERAQRYGTVHRVPGYHEMAQSEHTAIFNAVKARDLPELKRRHEQHVMTAAEQLVRHLATEQHEQEVRK